MLSKIVVLDLKLALPRLVFDKNLSCFFFILFTVDVVRRKAVAIAMKHLQIQSFVTGKFSYFFMTFTTIYIEIDSCKITVMAKYSWYKKKA